MLASSGDATDPCPVPLSLTVTRTGPRPMGKQARFYLDSGAEAFDNQEQIKRQQEDGSPYRRDLRRAAIGEAAQDMGPPGEVDEGDHRKRQGGAGQHLAQPE